MSAHERADPTIRDGAQLGDLAQTGTSVSEPTTPPNYVDLLWFGLSAQGPLQGYDVWINDVYVDTSRVGCAEVMGGLRGTNI